MGTYSTNQPQEGDVLIFLQDDRGEIEEQDGFIRMTGTIRTMILLILQGGNDEDDGSEATFNLQWWGNEGEPPERQYRSRTQALLNGGVPLTSASVTTLTEAVTADLEDGLITPGIAESVELSTVEIINPKRVRIAGYVTMRDGQPVPFDMEV